MWVSTPRSGGSLYGRSPCARWHAAILRRGNTMRSVPIAGDSPSQRMASRHVPFNVAGGLQEAYRWFRAGQCSGTVFPEHLSETPAVTALSPSASARVSCRPDERTDERTKGQRATCGIPLQAGTMERIRLRSRGIAPRTSARPRRRSKSGVGGKGVGAPDSVQSTMRLTSFR